jgi:hypothetical protein
MQTLSKMLFVAVVLLSPYQAGAQVDSCACPKLACNLDCEYEDSVSFYSEKCSDGTKVKSCARPKCIGLPNAPAKCMAQNAAPSAAVTASAAAENRVPASVATEPRVGIVKELEGKVWIKRGADKEALAVGSIVNQSDKIETEAKSKVMVQFTDGNSIVITEKSVVELATFNFNEDITKRNTLLNLIKGKVRSNVKMKYTGKEQSFFQVKTPVAVAGVRGTDFIVSFGEDRNDLVSNIETLHGEVEFRSQVDTQSTIVGKEQKSKMVLRGAAKLVTDEGTLGAADWHGRAYLEPASTLDKKQISYIEKSTAFAALSDQEKARRIAAAEAADEICAKPAGKVNQCSWKCENNPQGEKVCRTDLPLVNCIRRMCNANGVWSDSFRLPASFGTSCEPDKTVVGPCDY